MVSHDLQEPLRTVSGFVQLLQKKYANQLDAEADKFIEYAVDGTKRMETLIKDLLAYSRVGTRSREPVPIDSGAALRQALDNLHESIQAAGAEITHGELPTVRADPLQLAQLFQNLHRQRAEVPQRSPAENSCGVCQDGDCWRFSVSDNGIGIDAQYQDQIFEIFRRLHTQKAVRRHRHRPGDLQEDRGSSRRADLGGIGTRAGSHLLFYAADMICP